MPQVPSLVSQDESCSFVAVTRARSKLVVDKKPLSQVIQDLEVTPDVLSDMQIKDESLRSCFQAAEKSEVRSAGDTFLSVRRDSLSVLYEKQCLSFSGGRYERSSIGSLGSFSRCHFSWSFGFTSYFGEST